MFKKEFNLEYETKKLLEMAISNHYISKCSNCQNFKEGCNINDLEAVWLVLIEIAKYYPYELQSFVRKQLLNDNFNYIEVMKLSGKSMYPSIEEGDIIISGGIKDIKIDDFIISYAKLDKSTILVHRCVGIDDDFIYLRGDNNIGVEKIKKEAIIGKVYQIIRKSGNTEIYNLLNKIIHENDI